MFKRIFLLTIGIIIGVSTTIYAKESDPILKQLESRSISVKNPFESQLPIKEEPVEPAITASDPQQPESEYKWEEEFTKAREDPILAEPIEEIPLPVPERPLPTVEISGIIWNSERPQAIINGVIVDIGDTIAEIQITGIQKTGIDGLFDGREVQFKP